MTAAPRADEGAEPSLHIVRVCELCACGAGGECHVPGCAFWMHDAPTGDTLGAIAGQVHAATADPSAAAPRADEGAERSKPHLLHGVFDSDGLTRFRLECPYEVKGVLPAGRRCWSLDDDGEIDSLQCFAKGWVDECGAELISFEITDPSFPIEVDVELHGLLQTPNLTLHVRSASSGDGGAPTACEYRPGTIGAESHCEHWHNAEDDVTPCCWCGSTEDDAGSCPGPAAPSPVPEEGPPSDDEKLLAGLRDLLAVPTDDEDHDCGQGVCILCGKPVDADKPHDDSADPFVCGGDDECWPLVEQVEALLSERYDDPPRMWWSLEPKLVAALRLALAATPEQGEGPAK